MALAGFLIFRKKGFDEDLESPTEGKRRSTCTQAAQPLTSTQMVVVHCCTCEPQRLLVQRNVNIKNQRQPF